MMGQEDRDSPDGDNSTTGWREHVRRPITTEPVERTSAEPPELAEQQAEYAKRFKKKPADAQPDEPVETIN